MKKWTNTDPMRRLLSLALSMAMVLSVLPAGALAEEVESTPPTCDCEVLCAETVKTDCPVCGTEGGQCAAVQQQKPEQQESEQKQEPVQEPKTETCAHGNDPETCEDCASAKKVAQVQALIVALPEEVTAENKEAAQSALSAVDEAKSALTESEQTKLDMTRYTALTQKLAALEAQVNNCAHGNAPESCPLCAVQALIDALPDGDSITADNAEEVIEQMGQIDAAAMLLSEAELAKLDFTKFEAAEARLTELSEQTATDQPVAYADNISYLDSNGDTQTCTTATVVTGSDTAWGAADTDTWYVVQDTVDIGTADAKQRVTVNGDVHLILADGCNFTVSGGISVNEGNSLTIYAQSRGENMGSLTAQNVENLYAGIGSDENYSGGTITINGGTVNATGGERAAGIGGGDNGSGGTITINGGVISAVGKHSGVGIGGGYNGSGGNITINGGKVTATGGNWGAGIGGGPEGSGGEITISGGEVTATGGENAAGIGGGSVSSGGDITISGNAIVNATGGSYGAGIGGGTRGDGGNITISGGTVTATGGSYGAGIGGGGSGWAPGGSGGTITITGGTVTATGGTNGCAGIGDGQGASTSGDSGTFSTGTDGRAVIFASSISNQSGKTDGTWSGIIFENNKGTVYGKPTLRTDLTIAEGQTLAIPEGTSLTIPAGVTLTNNGKVYLAGTLEGTIPGDVYYPLNLTDCTAEGDVVTYPDENGTPYAKAGSLITLTPDIPTNMAFTSWFTEEDIWDNRFNMPKNAVTITAKYEVPVASVTVDGIATNYAYFNEAYFAANNAKGTDITLKLLETLEKVPAVTVTGSFTLDLNGKKLTYTSMNSEAISVNGSLTITDSSDSKDGVIQNNTTSYVICNYGRLTIEGGAILAQNCICNSNNGTLVMNDGTLGAIGTDPGYRIFNEAGGTVTINGGTLKNGADRIFNTAEGITLQGGSFPDGISFTDDFRDHHVRSLLADGYAFYNPSDDTLMSVGNNDIGIRDGVVVLPHTHSFACEKKDDFEHTKICTCGYSEVMDHIFLEEGVDYNGFCKLCGAYQPAEGEGSDYSISNAGQLFWFADYVNNSTEPEARFAWGQLQGNITIPTKADGTKRAWMPIGIEHTPYCGWFNGNGHSISGLYFEGQMPYASLFGGVEGRIENLTIQSVEYDVSTDKIAGICGVLNSGQITNCTNAAHISSPHPDVNAAGICYQNDGTISGCTNTGTIDGSVAGGICVINNGSIEKCTNEGAIQGGNAGGICADNGSPQIRNCSIKDCANRVRINASYFAGGICARNFGTVSYSYHYGILNGGPIVDEMHSDGGSCSNCYYLADWETDEIDGTTFKTQEQFASGEVAYLLNNPNSDEFIWGQTLTEKNKQDYPVLDGDPVYRHNSSCPVYSNSLGESGEQHSLGENGICERCGAALEARVTVGGTDTYYTSLKDAFKAANEHTATITLLRDANIGEDETLEISGGNVTFQSAEKFDEAEGPTFYTVTLNRHGTAIDVMGGTFNFESGILKFSPSWQQYGIVVNSGGTLNFRGGAITGSTEVDSIKMVSGEVNISGGTVGLVETSRGTLNISGGTVHTLRVYHATTNLRGGSFQKIHMMVGGDVVFTLLADGYAYYCDGSWVDATNDEDAMTLEGGIRVRSIPVKIETQPKDVSFTYGDTDKTLTVAASGDGIAYQWYQVTPNEGGDPTEYPVGTGNPYSLPALDAGSYQYFCRLTCEGYVLDTDPVTVTVDKVIVTPPTVSDKEYNGQTQTADVTVGTDTPYTVEANPGGTDVGTYSVTLKLKDTANYKWADSENAEKTIQFKITQAENSWTTEPDIDGWTYGENASNPTMGSAKFGTVKVEYKVKDAADITYSEAIPTQAGSYTARFTVADTTNYAGLSDEKGFTINPKSLQSSGMSVTLLQKSFVYDGTEKTLQVTVKFDNTVLEEGTDYTLSSNTATDADSYTLTVTGMGNYSGTTTMGWQITKAPITPVVTIANAVYGETLNPSVTGNLGSGKVTYTYYSDANCTTEATPKNVGTYYVKATVAQTDNYLTGTSEAVSFQITKKSLTVTAKNHTITYGEAPANDGVTYSGFVNGEKETVLVGTLAYDYSYSQFDDVGDSYTITPKGLTSGNYAITFEQGTLTVQQKEIGIDWSNTQLTYNGKAQAPTATPTGLENNDAITLAVSGEKTDAGNDYTAQVDAIQGTKAGNYALPQSVTTPFSIEKKEVTITGTTVAASKVYDGTTTSVITNFGTLTGFVTGDDVNIDTSKSTAAYSDKNVGENKEVTFSGFSLDGSAAGNYTLTAQPASTTASITKKPVTLAITVEENLFDGTNGVNYRTSLESGTGFVDNDDVSIVPGDATFAYCYPAENIPVTFTAFSLTGADAGNYSITNPTPENVTGSIKVSNRYLNLENNNDFAGQTEVWVDGVACPVQTDAGTYAALPESGDLLTTYTYKQGTSTAAHENYPTGMAVYGIVRDDGGAKLQKIDELDNLLQYSGCSIRINGKPGIRMITSLTKETKEALKKGELAGYTLEEYGTVVAWDVGADMQLPLTLGSGNKHNYAYKKGVSDPVFANVGNLTQYTNVLVWDSLTDAQLAQDILMRPYIILSNEDGKTVTLYGGIVSRSIGYVAQQNAKTFPEGSAGYKYVHDIIDRVEKYKQNSGSTTTPGG